MTDCEDPTVSPTLWCRLIDYEFALETLDWRNLVYLAMTFVLLVVGKSVFSLPYKIAASRGKLGLGDKRTFNLDKMLLVADNKSLAVSFACFLFAMGLILVAVMGDLAEDLIGESISILMWLAFAALMMLGARWVNDVIILNKIANARAVSRSNIAVGIVEGCSYIASGIIAFSSLSGEGHGIVQDIITTVIFYLLGQLSLIIFTFIFAGIASYNVQEQIAQGNGAAGLAFGSAIVAIGIMVGNPIYKSDSIVTFGVWFLLGVVSQLLVRFLIDKFIISGDDIQREICEDNNWGVALIEASLSISVAICLTCFLRDELCPADHTAVA